MRIDFNSQLERKRFSIFKCYVSNFIFWVPVQRSGKKGAKWRYNLGWRDYLSGREIPYFVQGPYLTPKTETKQQKCNTYMRMP